MGGNNRRLHHVCTRILYCNLCFVVSMVGLFICAFVCLLEGESRLKKGKSACVVA